MNAAPLPCRAEHAGNGGLEPLVRVGDDQLDALQPAPDQAPEKAGPEGLRLRRPDVQPDDLAPALGIAGHGDYGRHRDDPPTLALAQVGRVEPEIRVVALQLALEESADPLIDLL